MAKAKKSVARSLTQSIAFVVQQLHDFQHVIIVPVCEKLHWWGFGSLASGLFGVLFNGH